MTRDDLNQALEVTREAIYGEALRKTGSVHDAADAAQDVMLRSLRYFDPDRPPEDVRAWLFQILRNVLCDGYTRRDFARPMPIDELEGLTASDEEILEKPEVGLMTGNPLARYADLFDRAPRVCRHTLLNWFCTDGTREQMMENADLTSREVFARIRACTNWVNRQPADPYKDQDDYLGRLQLPLSQTALALRQASPRSVQIMQMGYSTVGYSIPMYSVGFSDQIQQLCLEQREQLLSVLATELNVTHLAASVAVESSRSMALITSQIGYGVNGYEHFRVDANARETHTFISAAMMAAIGRIHRDRGNDEIACSQYALAWHKLLNYRTDDALINCAISSLRRCALREVIRYALQGRVNQRTVEILMADAEVDVGRSSVNCIVI